MCEGHYLRPWSIEWWCHLLLWCWLTPETGMLKISFIIKEHSCGMKEFSYSCSRSKKQIPYLCTDDRSTSSSQLLYHLLDTWRAPNLDNQVYVRSINSHSKCSCAYHDLALSTTPALKGFLLVMWCQPLSMVCTSCQPFLSERNSKWVYIIYEVHVDNGLLYIWRYLLGPAGVLCIFSWGYENWWIMVYLRTVEVHTFTSTY